VAVADVVLERYVNAPTLIEAEAELDRLVDRRDELPVALGDLYDELAELAADEDEFELAARLERKAIANGCEHQTVAREMLGWYLLKSGATAEGEAVFADLCAERPDDASIRITLGHARSDAGLADQALEAFDAALAAAKRAGFPNAIDRARIERRAEREDRGLEPDKEDKLAPAPRRLITQRPTAWALAWFPPDQRDAALAHWPELGEDFTDPQAYNRRLEHLLRDVDRELGHHPSVAPVDVDRFLTWAAEEGQDPASGEARAGYSAEMLRTGATISWPPGRNNPCWCKSGRKYKRCCGA
jgi:tetratricopeptide (TPR) repeat protein